MVVPGKALGLDDVHPVALKVARRYHNEVDGTDITVTCQWSAVRTYISQVL